MDCHLEASRLSERLLLLKTCERVLSGIKTGEWGGGVEGGTLTGIPGVREDDRAHREAVPKVPCSIVLYGGFIKHFKEGMEARDLRVEAVYLQSYWRSPLEARRTMLSTQGMDDVSNDVIGRCVECHLGYLEYILASEGIDTSPRKRVH